MSALHQKLAALASKIDGRNLTFGKVAGISSELDSTDNNTTPVSAGGIVNEHDKDQKGAQPQTVTDTAPLGDMQEAMQSDQGIDKSEPGDDPEIEQNYSMTTDDPGTSHPAKADATNKSARSKYASADFNTLRNLYNEYSQAVCADIIVRKQAAARPAAKQDAPTQKQAAAAALQNTVKPSAQNDAFAAGYKLAADLGLTKEAASKIVAEAVAELAAVANDDADMVNAFLRQKAAESSEDGSSEEMPGAESEESPEPGMSEGTSGGDSEGSDTTSQAVEELASAAPPEEGASAMDGASQDEALAALDDVLQEMGISPEELVQALQEAPAGDPAAMGMDPAAMGGDPAAMGMDPAAMGGMPPGPEAMPPELAKMASALYRVRMTKFASIANGTRVKRSSKHHATMRQYVKEVMGR